MELSVFLLKGNATAVNPGYGQPDQRTGHVRQCVRAACLVSVARGEVRRVVKDVVTDCGSSLTYFFG